MFVFGVILALVYWDSTRESRAAQRAAEHEKVELAKITQTLIDARNRPPSQTAARDPGAARRKARLREAARALYGGRWPTLTVSVTASVTARGRLDLHAEERAHPLQQRLELLLAHAELST